MYKCIFAYQILVSEHKSRGSIYKKQKKIWKKKYLEKGFMFSPKVKYSLTENIQDFPQESKSTIATVTLQRPTMETGHSDPKCSAPEKWGNDVRNG